MRDVCAQGDATAALAAIASRNRTHLPEAPLADASATVAAQRGLADVVGNARLRRRFVLMMAMWGSAFLVCAHRQALGARRCSAMQEGAAIAATCSALGAALGYCARKQPVH